MVRTNPRLDVDRTKQLRLGIHPTSHHWPLDGDAEKNSDSPGFSAAG
jgi:hypothetical protein